MGAKSIKEISSLVSRKLNRMKPSSLLLLCLALVGSNLNFLEATAVQKLSPYLACTSICNSTYVMEEGGFRTCMDKCPDCKKLGPIDATPEVISTRDRDDPYVEELCPDKCVKYGNPVQDMICRKKCPKTWCALKTNAFDPEISGSHDGGGSAPNVAMPVVIGLGLPVLVAFCAIVAFVCYRRKVRKHIDDNIEDGPSSKMNDVNASSVENPQSGPSFQ